MTSSCGHFVIMSRYLSSIRIIHWVLRLQSFIRLSKTRKKQVPEAKRYIQHRFWIPRICTLSQMNTSMDHLSQVVPRYESILKEMKLKIEILEVKSLTRVFIWKVNELGRRYCEAQMGRTKSLYSPPFYTSTHGSRLCLRVYLYGDGSGKGTHLSLFIVLMNSE